MSKKVKKQYKNVIGLIHPDSARHYDSKVLCNNPNIIVTDVQPTYSYPGWHSGRFTPTKDIIGRDYTYKGGISKHMFGFRPRRILVK